MISLQEKIFIIFAILETVHEGQRIIYCYHFRNKKYHYIINLLKITKILKSNCRFFIHFEQRHCFWIKGCKWFLDEKRRLDESNATLNVDFSRFFLLTLWSHFNKLILYGLFAWQIMIFWDESSKKACYKYINVILCWKYMTNWIELKWCDSKIYKNYYLKVG